MSNARDLEDNFITIISRPDRAAYYFTGYFTSFFTDFHRLVKKPYK